MTDRIKNPNWIGAEDGEDFDLKYIKEHKPIDPIIIDLKLKVAVNKDRMVIISEKKDKDKYQKEYEDLKLDNEVLETKIVIMEQNSTDQSSLPDHSLRFFGLC